jgi:hypothetical protein
MGGGAVRVSGCGEGATYVCVGDYCSREYTQQDIAPRSQDAAPRRSPGRTEVTAGRSKDGARILRAKITSRVMGLHFQAVPGKDNAMVLVGLQVRNRTLAHKDCSLRMMVDGRQLEMGETGYRYGNGMEELRTAMSYDDLFAMAEGSRVLGRVCEDEFRVDEERLQAVRELVLRIKEELSWQEQASEPAVADAGPVEPAAGEVL